MATNVYRLENNTIKSGSSSSDQRYSGGIGYMCFNGMKKHGKKLAQINITTGEEETYDALFKKCIRTAIVLRKKGIKKGDVIIMYSKTTVNSCVMVIASFFIGAVPLYLDAMIPLFETIDTIRNMNPKLFLVSPDFLETIQDILKNANQSTEVIAFTDDFFKPVEEENEFTPIYIDNLKETAAIHMSSGSTGMPKGVRLNHHGLAFCEMFSADFWFGNAPKVLLTLDCLYWGIETINLICSIEQGVCRLIYSEMTPRKSLWYILEKYEVNVAYLIPWVLIGMVESGKPNDIHLNSLQTIFVEGSLLSPKYKERLEKLLPNVDIFPIYGQTEASTLTVFRNIDLHREYNRTKPGCVGVPDFGVSLKVADLLTGEALGFNKHGELRVKSKTIMNGYYNLDSSDQFDDDGWFKTGDVVYYDEDFCIFIVSRIKDLVKFQGGILTPPLIEAQLLSHPAVKLAAVIGIPDDIDDEHPMALVALHDSCSSVTPKEIVEYIEKRVPDTHRLRGGVKIVNESCFKTGTKIKRFKLKQLVLSGEI